MELLILISIILLAAIGFSSYFIAKKVYKNLNKERIIVARSISVVTFILSFALMFIAVAYLFILNFSIER